MQGLAFPGFRTSKRPWLTGRRLLLVLWVIGILFPIEAWVRGHPVGWRLFQQVFALPWLHAVMHIGLFAGATVLLVPRPCSGRCTRHVLGGLFLLALGQEGFQALFGPFLGFGDAFRDIALDALGVLLGWLWVRPTRTHDPHFDLFMPWVYRCFHRVRPKTLFPHLNLSPGMWILDLGGGTGRVVAHLPRSVHAVVVDPSMGMLRAAPKQRVFWHRVCGLAEHLPFPNEAFDWVLIVDALHHFQEQARALHEAWRVLRPGGRLVIEEPDIEHPLGRWVPFLERVLLMRSRFLTKTDILDLLPEARVTAFERHTAQFVLVLEKPQQPG